MRTMIVLTFALALGCGGASTEASTRTANDAQPTTGASSAGSGAACPFTVQDVAEAPVVAIAGMRLRLRIPAGFTRTIGSPYFIHECGAVISFAESPPGPPPQERADFMDGMIAGILDSVASTNTACTETSVGNWACQGADAGGNIRRIVEGNVLAIVRSHGSFAPGVGEAFVSSATTDPNAPWDPVATMQLSLAPIEGMPLHVLSSPPILRYAAPDIAGGPSDARLLWIFLPYVMNEEHRDGSAWTDREVGREVGRRFITDLELTDVDMDTMQPELLRTTPIGNDIDFVANGNRDGRPVVVYGGYFREHFGVFLVIGSAPAAERARWTERFRAHVRSYRVVD